MRAGTLEIVAGPCQFLPAMSDDRRSFAWTGIAYCFVRIAICVVSFFFQYRPSPSRPRHFPVIYVDL